MKTTCQLLPYLSDLSEVYFDNHQSTDSMESTLLIEKLWNFTIDFDRTFSFTQILTVSVL